MPSISYAITVCNELEVKDLIEFIYTHKRTQDEICVLLDSPKASLPLLDYLYMFNSSNAVKLVKSEFKGHFADWKNELTSICTKDYIFQIDADEMPSDNLINYLPHILEQNEDCEVYLVPRINKVNGITQEHINKWGWKQNEEGWINFPDYQWRIYRNNGEIKWINKVHEKLEKFKTYSALPSVESYSLYHIKDIKRQEKQNEFYSQI